MRPWQRDLVPSYQRSSMVLTLQCRSSHCSVPAIRSSCRNCIVPYYSVNAIRSSCHNCIVPYCSVCAIRSSRCNCIVSGPARAFVHARRVQLGLGAEIPHLIILKPLDKLRGMLCLWNNIDQQPLLRGLWFYRDRLRSPNYALPANS